MNASEIAEEFLDAQEPIRAQLRARAYRSHTDNTFCSGLSDEELLAAAWADLPGERRWTPVVWSSETGRWSVCREQRPIVRWVSLDEPTMVAQYKGGWSLRKVAEAHGCTDMTVRYVLDRHNVQRRTISEANRGGGCLGRADVRLNEASVVDIRIRHWVHGESWEAIAEHYSIGFTTCRAAGVGRTWAHVPMPQACLEGVRMRRQAKRKPTVRAAKPVQSDPFDIERAKRLYTVELKSLRRTSSAMGICCRTLEKHFRRHGVPLRSKSDAAGLAWNAKRAGGVKRNA